MELILLKVVSKIYIYIYIIVHSQQSCKNSNGCQLSPESYKLMFVMPFPSMFYIILLQFLQNFLKTYFIIVSFSDLMF